MSNWEDMGTHYYTIKNATVISDHLDDQPVSQIMMTTGHLYYSVGIYETHRTLPRAYIKLTHISRWDYDMLDAFGVEVVTPDWLGKYEGQVGKPWSKMYA